MKKPRPHQKQAIKDVINGFKTSDRGQLIMACGSGKTLTALWIAESLKCQRILILFPSLLLLAQTVREWRENAKADYRYLAVCSRLDIDRENDDTDVDLTTLGVPVTTDPVEIRKFLNGGEPLVVLGTYHSSTRIGDAFASRCKAFDIVFCDEAHRTAQAKDSTFATVLDDSNIQARRRLFMTATQRIYREEDDAVASMDDEEIYGPEFHHLSFTEAIDRKLLCDYQVVILGIDGTKYDHFLENGALTIGSTNVTSGAELAKYVEVIKGMKKYDLSKMLSFHSRIASSEEFSVGIHDIMEWMPSASRPSRGIWSSHVAGILGMQIRDQRLDTLRSTKHRALLASAQCLSEGVDVPSVDAVIFVDPRQSPISIVQAIGRVLRTDPNDDSKIGTILLPVVVRSHQDTLLTVESSEFSAVWRVLRTMKRYDERLVRALDHLRNPGQRQTDEEEDGRLGGTDGPVRGPQIILDIDETISKEFVNSLTVKIVDVTADPLSVWLKVLRRYHKKFGHIKPKQKEIFEGKEIGLFVHLQRTWFKRDEMSKERIRAIGSVPGWSWKSKTHDWFKTYEKHKALICSGNNLPMKTVVWRRDQRIKHAAGKLTKEQQELLESLPGWYWTVKTREMRWEDGYRRLTAFVKTNGRLPTTHDGVRTLYSFINWNKRDFKQGTLSAERKKLLDAIPEWTSGRTNNDYDARIRLLEKHIVKHGSLTVSADSEIRKHTLYIRQAAIDGKLSIMLAMRASRLVGMVPGEETWEGKFQVLKEFYRKNPTFTRQIVPAYLNHRGSMIWSWLTTQRRLYGEGILPRKRIKALESLRQFKWGEKATAARKALPKAKAKK